MNPVPTLVLSLALLVGGAGAVLAFESASQPDPAAGSVGPTAERVATPTGAHEARQGRRHHHRAVLRWAPCPDGTTLVDDACVTDVVKTVTLPVPAAQAVAHATSGSRTPSGGGGARDDHGGDDHGHDRDDHGGDDHGHDGDGHHGGEHDD